MRLGNHIIHQVIAYLPVYIHGTKQSRDSYEESPHNFVNLAVNAENLVKTIAPGRC